ncbi:hypothetical protein Bpfe_031102 [Biomphalaria pfeifferi]|uniref:Uncharacterized protein n=1 Tax=Biomphalaria pfeifferi TaxID=112525 RepID=A0AAD8ETM9_BIOPF|nr:hypothetical protein Bpfe_031102 [Biomphalaria pfeifferi]
MSHEAVNDAPAAPIERTPYVPPSRRSADEDRAWARLYQLVLNDDAAVSEEVIKALDADPQAKHVRLALYTHSKTTLRKQKVIAARNKRLADGLALAVTSLVMAPVRLVRSVGSFIVSVGVALTPPLRKEPAKGRMAALKADPVVAQAIAELGAGAVPPAPAAAGLNLSRRQGRVSAQSPAGRARYASPRIRPRNGPCTG